MKTCTRKAFCWIFALLIVASSSIAFARASDQLRYHFMDVTPIGDGDFEVYADVRGTGIMDRIGFESIEIYEKRGLLWIKEASYDVNDSGMYIEGSSLYSGTLTYHGSSGSEYKVVITIFAEDANGTDSRTKTFYVTA